VCACVLLFFCKEPNSKFEQSCEAFDRRNKPSASLVRDLLFFFITFPFDNKMLCIIGMARRGGVAWRGVARGRTGEGCGGCILLNRKGNSPCEQ
jgi:hypothetical protein